MPQVNLRNEEIKSLKTQNQKLAEIIKKREEERNIFENKNKELLDINGKLTKQLSGQFLVQGVKQILWDMIIAEATKLRCYPNYIKDKEMEINVARQSCTTVKETLDRKPIDTPRNTINLLNTLSKEELRTMRIKDIITVITWVRNVIGKHHHIESVQAKEDLMLYQVKYFKSYL